MTTQMTTLCIVAYLASCAFTFCWCMGDWLHSFGRVTRGDIAFFCFMAVIPGIGIILWVIASTNGFWSKQVWPK